MKPNCRRNMGAVWFVVYRFDAVAVDTMARSAEYQREEPRQKRGVSRTAEAVQIREESAGNGAVYNNWPAGRPEHRPAAFDD